MRELAELIYLIVEGFTVNTNLNPMQKHEITRAIERVLTAYDIGRKYGR